MSLAALYRWPDMQQFLVVDNSKRDSERFSSSLAKEGRGTISCDTGTAAQEVIETRGKELAAAIILWEIPGPPFGFELLAMCRRVQEEMPVVIVSGMLDAALAARAKILGARDFLEKPLDSERIRSCLSSLLAVQDPLSPLVVELQKKILGKSAALVNTLKQIAKHILRPDNILLIGESGTGKELLAQAIHQFGPHKAQPNVAVNVAQIPRDLMESVLFGHERGAFTGATDRHVGLLEEADRGTLFLDEIGELEMSLQAKLLRVIQEREFRRLKGSSSLPFAARLVCATNRDLAESVKAGKFREDLYHRIAEVTIKVPPLRARTGDVELLLMHFFEVYADTPPVKMARETLTILRSYPYPGNIRELQNVVKSALIEAEGQTILPQHLPLESMGAFLELRDANTSAVGTNPDRLGSYDHLPPEILRELQVLLPDNWLTLPYREAIQIYEKAFDRVYLPHLLSRCHHKVTRAADAAGIDTKTFRKKWRDGALPPLTAGEEEPDG
jgi:DNA-binding NtrC family response regulator